MPSPQNFSLRVTLLLVGDSTYTPRSAPFWPITPHPQMGNHNEFFLGALLLTAACFPLLSIVSRLVKDVS